MRLEVDTRLCQTDRASVAADEFILAHFFHVITAFSFLLCFLPSLTGACLGASFARLCRAESTASRSVSYTTTFSQDDGQFE